MIDKDDRPPNDDLRQARLRTPSPTSPGRPMSRQELADAVNAYIGDQKPREGPIDANYRPRGLLPGSLLQRHHGRSITGSRRRTCSSWQLGSLMCRRHGAL